MGFGGPPHAPPPPPRRRDAQDLQYATILSEAVYAAEPPDVLRIVAALTGAAGLDALRDVRVLSARGQRCGAARARAPAGRSRTAAHG